VVVLAVTLVLVVKGLMVLIHKLRVLMALVVAVAVVDRLMMVGLLVSMGKAQVAQGAHLHFIQQGVGLLALLTEVRVEKAVVLPQLLVV
jgi:hypothetical protein